MERFGNEVKGKLKDFVYGVSKFKYLWRQCMEIEPLSLNHYKINLLIGTHKKAFVKRMNSPLQPS